MSDVSTSLEVHSKRTTLTEFMAEKHHLSGAAFLSAIRATVFKEGTNEQLCAFLMVAQKYELDPILKEIYAFPTQGGGIIPIVSIDGWYAVVNRHPQSDGVEFIEKFDEKGVIYSVTAKHYRKDRSRPIEVTEYYHECKRNTSPWTQWPIRMLRHKAYIQGARVAYSLSGIYDPDEAARIEPSLGPVIEASENGYHEVTPEATEESTRIDELLKTLEWNHRRCTTLRNSYAGREKDLIAYLEEQVSKKADTGAAPQQQATETSPSKEGDTAPTTPIRTKTTPSMVGGNAAATETAAPTKKNPPQNAAPQQHRNPVPPPIDENW